MSDSDADTSDSNPSNSTIGNQDAPPPYSACTPHGERPPRILEADVERLRNFLLHCLCVDYGCRAFDNVLSATDLDTFLDCEAVIAHSTNLSTEVTVLPTSYLENSRDFRRYIVEPCQALDIPLGTALLTLYRFMMFRTRIGRAYRGCLYSIFNRHGRSRFAEKLWLDKNIILPRLLLLPGQVAIIEDHIASFTDETFAHLSGVTFNTFPAPMLPMDCGRLQRPVRYTLHARDEYIPGWDSECAT